MSEKSPHIKGYYCEISEPKDIGGQQAVSAIQSKLSIKQSSNIYFQTSDISRLTPMYLPQEATGGYSVIYLKFGTDDEDEKNSITQQLYDLGQVT